MKKLSAIICLVFCFCANLFAQSLPSVIDRNNHELKGKVKQLTIREYRAFINGDKLEKQDLVYTTIFHFFEDGKYQEIEYIDTDSQTKSVYLYSDSITLIKWFDGNNEIRTDTIIYTNFGKKIKEVYADGSFEMVKKTYKYNDQNQLVEVRHTFAEPEHKQIYTHYKYNTNGQLIEFVKYDNSLHNSQTVYSFEYDTLGRITQNKMNWSWDDIYRISQIFYQYNAQGFTSSCIYKDSNSSARIETYTYEYDQLGNYVRKNTSCKTPGYSCIEEREIEYYD